jgi:hypothetical protein
MIVGGIRVAETLPESITPQANDHTAPNSLLGLDPFSGSSYVGAMVVPGEGLEPPTNGLQCASGVPGHPTLCLESLIYLDFLAR